MPRMLGDLCMTMCLMRQQDFRPPEQCSYLQPGQQFHGTQRGSQASTNSSEDWGVQVHIAVRRSVICTAQISDHILQVELGIMHSRLSESHIGMQSMTLRIVVFSDDILQAEDDLMHTRLVLKCTHACTAAAGNARILKKA